MISLHLQDTCHSSHWDLNCNGKIMRLVGVIKPGIYLSDHCSPVSLVQAFKFHFNSQCLELLVRNLIAEITYGFGADIFYRRAQFDVWLGGRVVKEEILKQLCSDDVIFCESSFILCWDTWQRLFSAAYLQPVIIRYTKSNTTGTIFMFPWLLVYFSSHACPLESVFANLIMHIFWLLVAWFASIMRHHGKI